MAQSDSTHVGILKRTQKQISILARVMSNDTKVTMYDLVGLWADEAWEKAKKAGLVTDAMLNAHWVSPQKKDKS